MARYYLGVDWGDEQHGVCVCEETGAIVWEGIVAHTPMGLSVWGRQLDEWCAAGIELWAAIEKPDGRVVDYLLDHGVVVYPVNPKAVDRARDRFRMSASKSDTFDGRVLAQFLRTDHAHLPPLQPSSVAAQEVKLLTRDHTRIVRQQTRTLNQLTSTLKEYYPRVLDLFGDLTTQLALDFLQTYPTPATLTKLRLSSWQRFARQHRLGSMRTTTLWEQLHAPQLPVPEHVVRAKARLVAVLVAQVLVTHRAVTEYQAEIERFFVTLSAAEWMQTLPGGLSGTMIPRLWAELGDAPGRWASWSHLQAQAGTVPLTRQSGKSCVVRFRVACNKYLRQAIWQLAFHSLRQSEWAKHYYQQCRARGHQHNQALRTLGAKWLKIIFRMWQYQVPYDESYHLANITRQYQRATA
jgi:transposase